MSSRELDATNSTNAASYHDTLANHGRWGADDEAGTLNLITAQDVVRAAGLVRSGIHVSCSRPVGMQKGKIPQRSVLHLMTRSGKDNPEEGSGEATDWVGVGLHGTEYTHLDAHSHIFWNGEMYNHRSMGAVTTNAGALTGGLEPAFHGIVGRGILMDAAEQAGIDCLEYGATVSADQLDAWFAAVSIEPRAGDVLYVRTGNKKTEDEGGFPGLAVSALPWFKEHDISVLVTDAVADTVPSHDAIEMPIHSVGIAAMGMWFVDNAALDTLSKTCSAESRYEFLTILAPIPFRRATGSLVNPLAVF